MRATSEACAGRWLVGAILVLVTLRGVSLGFYPLMDTTEARYADIARRMLERGDWITPWFVDGRPFWGKPPMSFWLSAASFKLFGFNEAAARIPHFLLGAFVAALTWRHARRASHRAAWHALALLAGSALFVWSAGAVMTDMSLTLGTTLVMVGFWRAQGEAEGDATGRLQMRLVRTGPMQMVAGITIGLLAKGPVSVLLWALPIVTWAIARGDMARVWRRLPWVGISAVSALLSLPWYVMAETRTPGFLDYFLVGEHWHRFVTPGWGGDLYGSAHRFPHGSIWAFALGACAPWPLLLGVAGLIGRDRAAGAPPNARGESLYLWLWALTPCTLFTLAGNILWTYVLPGLPAMALLAASWTATRQRQARIEAVLTAGVGLGAATIVALLVTLDLGGRADRQSAKSLVSAYAALARPAEPLYFLGSVPFSGSFYSGGKALAAGRIEDLPEDRTAFVILDAGAFKALTPEAGARLEPMASRGGRMLMHWR